MFSNPSYQPISYLFIDGAYLSAFAKSAGELWYGDAAEIDHKNMGHHFRKIFYYDCLPAKTDKETAEEFVAKTDEKERFFDSLRSIDGWHVSEGLAKWKKKGGSRQKEVDISIAVDMLTHTYRKNMDQLTFVAGDQDFRPLLEAVVREGMYVTLRYGKKSISRELMHAADAKQELGYYELHNLCTENFRNRHPIPSRSFDTVIGGGNLKIVEVAFLNGFEIAWLYKSAFTTGGYALYAGTDLPAPQAIMRYQSEDPKKLKEAHEFCHGAVDWRLRGIS